MSQPSDTASTVPAFPWNAFIRNIAVAALIALVIGTLCYHFLADQSWSDAALSSAPWVAVAIFGTALGHGFAHYFTVRNAS